MTPRAIELATTILQMCSERPLKTLDKGQHIYLQDIIAELGEKNKHDISSVIKGFLLPMSYIRVIDDSPAYSITQLGKTYLNSQHGSSSFTIGDNVNFAYNSPGAQQSISINDLDEDIRVKINELDEAIQKNDKATFKKTLAYIADKSVDVAIALVTGSLVR
jgi:hypothetical protein